MNGIFSFKALFSRLVPEKNGKREFSNIMLGRLKVKILYIVSCILHVYLCWPTGLFITSFLTLNLNMVHVSRVDCYLMGLVSLTILHIVSSQEQTQGCITTCSPLPSAKLIINQVLQVYHF